jgi:trans-2,3-dihydro-3-hydroxyanthranilate isomerase
MRRRFVTLDVFTGTRFAGNPLAVVFEAGNLDTAAMQLIAREFGHPETVFVLPPENPAHRAKLRIFTPAIELPFAGHPTVGAAVALGRLDGSGGCEIVVEENVGPVRCKIEPLDADSGRATFLIPRLPEPAAAAADAAAIAEALGVDEADIGFDGFKPSCWSAGNAFTFVPLRSMASIKRAQPDSSRFDAVLGTRGRATAYLFCRETSEAGHDFHARMFAPTFGIREDPATGSAVAAFSGLLAATGQYRDGDHFVRIEQGYEMGRPSLIELSFTMSGGRLAAASIGGAAIVVTEGTIEA